MQKKVTKKKSSPGECSAAGTANAQQKSEGCKVFIDLKGKVEDPAAFYAATMVARAFSLALFIGVSVFLSGEKEAPGEVDSWECHEACQPRRKIFHEIKA